MADFKSGVARYIWATAQVAVSFPVDQKGSEDVCCYQCKFYRRNYRACGLNNEICEYPEKYIGSNCPLTFIEKENEQ